MGLFRKKKNLPPHKIHPNVLHWKEGDELIYLDPNKSVVLGKVKPDDIHSFPKEQLILFSYKSLTPEGDIVVEEKESKNLRKFEFKKFIASAKNVSLSNRALTSVVENSTEYMELIDEFQKAYNELETSDKDQRLLE